MNSLSNLDLRPSYHKGEQDISRDFYLPCMRASRRYDRAVGFFSSSIYAIAWPALPDFVDRGGRIRIICSPAFSQGDFAAIEYGYEERKVGENLAQTLRDLLAAPQTRIPTQILSSLVASGVLDFRVALAKTTTLYRRIFHDKVGIFSDEFSNRVVFKGSMNETWLGLAADGNIESIDVFVEWYGGRDATRVQDEVDYFEALWTNTHSNCDVRPFPEVARDEILAVSEGVDWRKLLEDPPSPFPTRDHSARPAKRSHQVRALDEWTHRGRRGIFEHATGSGKTLTALWAIEIAFRLGEVPIILVPSELLLEQWVDEIKQFFGTSDRKVLACGAGHTSWRGNDLLRAWTRSANAARVVVATMQTASTDDFRGRITQGSHLFIVADEVHRLGAPQLRRIFQIVSGARLGLSATPTRSGDTAGTAAILDYFDAIITPPYTLQDAIKDGVLTPYAYHVHTVSLTAEEQDEWNDQTAMISRLAAQYKASKDSGLWDKITHLLIQRARITKTASGKLNLASRVLSQNYKAGARWIVYCDSEGQLSALSNKLRADGFNPLIYHSSMSGDRKETLEYFIATGGIVLSIRCLDEGVNIPSVTDALILASSTNRREFIQRRGRVLRHAPGKQRASIHDALVLPSPGLTDDTGTHIVESELARAIEFGLHAVNPTSILDLQRIAVRYGIDYNALINDGIENDE